MMYCKLYQHNFGHLSLIHHSSLQVLTMQSTTEAHREEPPSPPQLPFRSLSELMTEHFQAYGSGIRNAILEGVKEINNDIPYPQQTLRAQATQTLLEKSILALYFGTEENANVFCKTFLSNFDHCFSGSTVLAAICYGKDMKHGTKTHLYLLLVGWIRCAHNHRIGF